MSENLGTIKILEGRIITRKNDLTEIWSTGGGDPFNYIVYNGTTYRLLNGKEDKSLVIPKKKYEEIEEEIDNLDDLEDPFDNFEE
jgi:hypothetical protein